MGHVNRLARRFEPQMTVRKKSVLVAAQAFLLLVVCPAYAQIAALGKGWLLDSAGSITSASGEVISGKNSIKGSYQGSNPFTPFLSSDPTFVQFAPNQTYTIAVRYRILTAGPAGFPFGFFSSSGGVAGQVPSGNITGVAGESGTAVVTTTLPNYSDYEVQFKIGQSGTIVIDDISVTDASGRLVASENAEGPAIVPGPLNFLLTDAISLLTDANALVMAAAAKDPPSARRSAYRARTDPGNCRDHQERRRVARRCAMPGPARAAGR